MIPRTIHYCWFGGKPLPEIALNCIASWKKYCPDYEIICWNETNYSLDGKCVYVQEAFEEKKWAFVSDYVRLDIVYNYGGIYLDTDVELIASLDDLLNNKCFLGLETTGFINTGLGFGAEMKNMAIKKMLDEYDDIHFRIDKDIFDTTPCPRRNTAPFWGEGFKNDSIEIQHLDSIIVYPTEYFCPIDYETKEMNITENTKSIHHYSASWISETDKEIERLTKAYKENHGKISVVLYKNYIEYKMRRQEEGGGIYSFVVKKLKKKWMKTIGKLT